MEWGNTEYWKLPAGRVSSSRSGEFELPASTIVAMTEEYEDAPQTEEEELLSLKQQVAQSVDDENAKIDQANAISAEGALFLGHAAFSSGV